MRNVTFLLLFILCIRVYSQNTILDARSMSIGDTVSVTGIALNGSELGNIRYIQDTTAGIAVYNSVADATLTAVISGDEISVTGVLKNYNSLLEIDPVISVTLNSSGNSYPAIQIIAPTEMNETTESEQVQFHKAIISGSGNFTGNTNYYFTSNGVQGQLRIGSACPLVGQPIPTTMVILTGICSQYAPSGTGGYQLLLRTANDITPDYTLQITSPLQISNINPTGFTIGWTTNINSSSELYYGKTTALELGHINASGSSTSHSVTIDNADAAEFYYVKALSVDNGDSAFSTTEHYITQSNSQGWIKIYFNRSVDNSVSTGTNAITLNQCADDTIINYINRAKYTLDIAIYNFITDNISNISGAINAAYARGVRVRVIYDGSASNNGIDALNSLIGKIARPVSSGIMHNKFMIIDAYSADPNDPIVWAGSMNWTVDQINTDANNILFIQDQSLAKVYQVEFEEMFGSSGDMPNSTNAKFGGNKSDNTPHELVIGSSRVQSFFSPSDGVTQQILNSINASGNELYVETNLITVDNIGYAISDKANAGITTKAIVSSPGQCSANVVSALTSSLGDNFRDYNEGGILHHKLMISDPNFTSSDPFVLTGSHNWSASAETANDENILIIHDATVANQYYQEFVKRFGLSLIVGNNTMPYNKEITAYPNPGDGTLFINNTGGNAITLTIYDISGKSIFTEEVSGNPLQKIETGITEKGIYLVKISGKNSTQFFKYVVE